MNIYQKLAAARVKLQQNKLKKTGYNKFSNYYYFQLDDFLPAINSIFEELNLCSHFIIRETELGEVAYLTIYDAEAKENDVRKIIFEAPTADSGIKGASAIQLLGGKHTYMRRYLWLEAMEIVEADAVDGLSEEQKELPSKTPINGQTVEKIRSLYTDDEIETMLQRLKLKDISQLKMSQANKMIMARTGLNDQTETY